MGRWGKNKDHDRLPQINLALLYAGQTRIPVSFRKLAGNIADVSTIRHLLREVEFLNIPKVKLILDRGFYSKENINALLHQHHKFLIAVKIGLEFVQKQLNTVRETLQTRKNYSSKYQLHCCSMPVSWDYEEVKPRSGEKIKGKRRTYLHLYYDAQRAADDLRNFNNRLDTYEQELLSNKRSAKHTKQYAEFFIVKKTPVRGIIVTVKEAAVKKAERNFGYFALFSNDLKDPLEVAHTVSDTGSCRSDGAQQRIPQFNSIFLRDPVSDTLVSPSVPPGGPTRN